MHRSQRAKALKNLSKQARKITGEICKLNRYIEVSGNADEMEKLERESKLVRRVKPLLSQRSISMDKLSIVDLQLVP